MPAARRQALLDWATRMGAWVVEDDYVGEFRYEGRPLEALQALDRAGRVIYVGTSPRRARGSASVPSRRTTSGPRTGPVASSATPG
jgi:GntR family transcriptional regulator/MocR family aminotransferase